MKKLEIYRSQDHIKVEIKDEFEGEFTDISEVMKCLDVFDVLGKLDQYALVVEEEFWKVIIDHLNKVGEYNAPKE